MKKLFVVLPAITVLLFYSLSIFVFAQVTPLDLNTQVTDYTDTNKTYSFELTEKSSVVITLSMDSDTDYDLYVKWDGTQPSMRSYDCRPWRTKGKTEECTNTLESGTYYILVNHWIIAGELVGSGNYTLKLNATPVITERQDAFRYGRATADTGVIYGNYKIYADLGYGPEGFNEPGWVRILIKDQEDNVIDTMFPNKFDCKDSAVTGLTICLINIKALQNGTVIGADLVVGQTYC